MMVEQEVAKQCRLLLNFYRPLRSRQIVITSSMQHLRLCSCLVVVVIVPSPHVLFLSRIFFLFLHLPIGVQHVHQTDDEINFKAQKKDDVAVNEENSIEDEPAVAQPQVKDAPESDEAEDSSSTPVLLIGKSLR